MAQERVEATTAETDTYEDAFPIFHLRITDGGVVVLPPELLRRLGVEVGDTVAISMPGKNQGTVYGLPRGELAPPVAYKRAPDLRGLLEDYFTDREDVQRFLDEERGR